MKTLGRVLVRKGNRVGLFGPLTGTLPDGVYDVMENLGELCLTYRGNAAMPDERLQKTPIEDLVGEPSALMTKAEHDLLRE